MVAKVDDEEIQKAFENIKALLNGMLNDRSVPRNIKRVSQRCLEQISNEDETPGTRAANIMYMIDDLSLDPNLPFHSRTTIYRILSVLEKIKDK